MPKHSNSLVPLLTLVLIWLGSVRAWSQVSVLTQHNDIRRTGANLNESTLTTSNVNAGQFGKLFSRSVDGQIYAQPLYVPNVDIPGQGTRNVVYVATMKNTVYAFDADDPNASAPYWQANFGPGVPWQETGCTVSDIDDVVGITATPVIDLSSATLYFVAKTKENGSYFQRLHALDLTTGQARIGSPVTIQATIPGTGDGSNNGQLSFSPQMQLNRSGLLLLNGYVYMAFGSHCDAFPYHGWVFSYNAVTLQQMAVYNPTPNNGMSGIWMGGNGLVADANGYIYFMTGNGRFNANTGGTAYGQSFVKLATPSLTVLDYFTPHNFSSLNDGGLDLGSAGPLLIPGTSSLLGGGKEGVSYLVDTNNMGHFNAANDQVLQEFQATNHTESPIHGSPIYWNSPNYGPLVYLWGDDDYLKAFRFVNGLLQTNPVATGTIIQGTGNSGNYHPHSVYGAMLSLSANGKTAGTGVLWAARSFGPDANHTTVPGILHAFDASNVAIDLWNSKQNPARDDLGNFAKFCPPTVANGKVYLATFSNQLVVYGHLPPDTQPPTAPSNLSASTTTATWIALSWTPSTDNAGVAGYQIFRGSSLAG